MPDLNPVQFDHERVGAAQAIPVEQRRLQSFGERKAAAKRNATQWAVQVDHSSHDDLKQGVTAASHTKVVLSKEEFPDAVDAEQTALLMGVARGTYPTGVKHL